MSKIVFRGTAAVTVFLGFLCLMVIMALIRGFVIYKMWNWFIVPLGAVEIGILHAYGLSLMVGIVFSFLQQEKKSEKSAPVAVLELLLNNAFVLLLGWFVHRAM